MSERGITLEVVYFFVPEMKIGLVTLEEVGNIISLMIYLQSIFGKERPHFLRGA